MKTTRSGRKNSSNIDIIVNKYNEITEFNQKAILYSFDSKIL